MIKVYQIDGMTVPPLADARLYEFLSGGVVGVVIGCEITSLGANQIKVSAGWILLKGRVIEIQEETILVITSSSDQVDGRLLLQLDVSNNETPGTWVSQAQTPLPALTQEDINGSGTIYQLPMATYKVDQLQVTELKKGYPVAHTLFSRLYTATYLLDGWAEADEDAKGRGYNWTQTVQLVAEDGNEPTVTEDSVFMQPPTYLPTQVVSTDEVLDEALAIIDGGYTTSDAGTVTTYVVDKPTADIPVRWEIK